MPLFFYLKMIFHVRKGQLLITYILSRFCFDILTTLRWWWDRHNKTLGNWATKLNLEPTWALNKHKSRSQSWKAKIVWVCMWVCVEHKQHGQSRTLLFRVKVRAHTNKHILKKSKWTKWEHFKWWVTLINNGAMVLLVCV